MKLKELESWLSRCEGFKKPKINLEQYCTSGHIAARMLYSAQENIQGGSVCDLGSGCGILAIGSVLVGAQYVCGIEIDPDAIDIALENCTEFFDDDDDEACPIDFINAELDVNNQIDEDDKDNTKDCCERLNSCFDVKKLAKSREEFDCLVNGQVLAEIRYDLPKTYKFHKEKTLDIAVDFWCFEKVT